MSIPEIARQYLPSLEKERQLDERPWKGNIETGIHGTERMYGSEMIAFTSMQCATRCTACIRKNYDASDILVKEDLPRLVDYVNREGIKEVLLTGGDPLMNPDWTLEVAHTLADRTGIRHLRIGTAVLRADPTRITPELVNELKRLNKYTGFIEVSPHFDHPAEFFPETTEKVRQLNEAGIKLYVQTILLKGVNDNPETFRELAEQIRDNGMEWHYLYHCVPVSGNLHLRTTVEKGFDLVESLENHEHVTGRHPPKRYTLPSKIGKIYLDRSRLAEREREYVWVESRYILDSLRGKPLPDFCRVGKNGFLQVKYLNGIN
jgi:lysine 2,3-aminomutase